MPKDRTLPLLALLAAAASAPAAEAQCRRAPPTVADGPGAAPAPTRLAAARTDDGRELGADAPAPTDGEPARAADREPPPAPAAKRPAAAASSGQGDAPPPEGHEADTDASPPAPPVPKPDYTVAPGETLRAVLARWAGADGWQLVWDAGNDYALDAAARFPGGDLERAVTQLLEALQRSGAPYGASLASGNRVVRITRVR